MIITTVKTTTQTNKRGQGVLKILEGMRIEWAERGRWGGKRRGVLCGRLKWSGCCMKWVEGKSVLSGLRGEVVRGLERLPCRLMRWRGKEWEEWVLHDLSGGSLARVGKGSEEDVNGDNEVKSWVGSSINIHSQLIPILIRPPNQSEVLFITFLSPSTLPSLPPSLRSFLDVFPFFINQMFSLPSITLSLFFSSSHSVHFSISSSVLFLFFLLSGSPFLPLFFLN